MKKMKTIIGMVSILTASLSEISNCSNSTNGKGEIQLVTDGGKINDLSFIQQSWEAIKEFANAHNITYSNKLPSQSSSDHEFINCYKATLSSKAKVIVAAGYRQKNALIKYANDHKNIKFVTVDFKINENSYKKNNVAQICYKAEQSGFWAGIASCAYLNANVTKYMKDNNKLKIGSFGGMDIEAVTSYMFGFHCATFWWNENLTHTALELTKKLKNDITQVHPVINITFKNHIEAFSGTFKPTDGLIITEKLLKLGANIIFPIAGVQTQDVITKINSSKNKNVKIIGVDTDQSNMYINDKKLFLTSSLKKIKQSVIDTLKQWQENNDNSSIFKEEEIYGDYKNKLVGIAESSYITNELIEKIKTLTYPTEKISQMWEEICQDKSSNQLWEKAMKKDITF